MLKVIQLNENDLFYQVCKTPHEIESAKDGLKAMYEGLGNNIAHKTGLKELGSSIQIFLRDNNNNIIGGIIGHVFGGWIYIALLWIDERYRNRGYGTKLLEMIENEAIKKGCTSSHLDTYSFEARPFYEKHGYTLFATLKNYPKNHSKYFLKKNLEK